MSGPVHDDAQRERPALLGLAYRMLGSVTDAEDAVQETYARWYRLSEAERADIRSPRAWLLTAASRISLDALTSARARREQYVGDWLPEPVPGAGTWSSGPAPVDPADRVTLDDSVSMALLVVLETMTPAERVVFVLHDVFRYTFDEIAEIVGRTPAACRKLASSARRRIREQRRTRAAAAEHAATVRAFQHAWETGDLDALVAVLDPEATAIADGGGVVTASRKPITGGARIADALFKVRERRPGFVLEVATVNARPGLVVRFDGEVGAVVSFEVADGRIERIWTIANPHKLGAWQHAPER